MTISEMCFLLLCFNILKYVLLYDFFLPENIVKYLTIMWTGNGLSQSCGQENTRWEAVGSRILENHDTLEDNIKENSHPINEMCI